MMLSIKDFFSKCDQIRILTPWKHQKKNPEWRTSFFCAVSKLSKSLCSSFSLPVFFRIFFEYFYFNDCHGINRMTNIRSPSKIFIFYIVCWTLKYLILSKCFCNIACFCNEKLPSAVGIVQVRNTNYNV